MDIDASAIHFVPRELFDYSSRDNKFLAVEDEGGYPHFSRAFQQFNSIVGAPEELSAMASELILGAASDIDHRIIAHIMAGNLNYKKYKIDHSTVYVYLDVLISLGYKRLATYLAQILTRQLVVIELIGRGALTSTIAVKGPYCEAWIKWRRLCGFGSWDAETKRDLFRHRNAEDLSASDAQDRFCLIRNAVSRCHKVGTLVLTSWGAAATPNLGTLAFPES